jgi:hypothetical protein
MRIYMLNVQCILLTISQSSMMTFKIRCKESNFEERWDNYY